MDKIKIYDFDKTLVDCDSIGVLLRIWLRKSFFNFFKLIFYLIKGSFAYLFSFSFDSFKDKFIPFLKDFTEEELKKFSENLIESHGYKNLIEEIEEDGYTTILCSASINSYMKYVKDILGFDYLICTQNDNCHLIGKNNSKEEKARNLKKLFNEKNIVVDYENSKSYTDSVKNDKWMCSFTKNKYVVNSEKTYEGYINIDGINE
ncbi:MAG: haloacid dehalogenase-like hydrolase [Ezakiella sp.]|nr:haloacid dehalogenase-like hydrolase [Ezakiella sp.]MDD7472314.1 haloacid dehalogenase-like hydrolase [Bacillota bacterium]MDY3923051.1 haloacid dehalogenase-like hydrolase [Ezakiella sp.]